MSESLQQQLDATTRLLAEFQIKYAAEKNRALELEAKLAEVRAELDRRRPIGAMMARMCFNGKQLERIPNDYRQRMDELQRQWDEVSAAVSFARYLREGK